MGGEIPAAAGSALAGIRERRERAVAKLHLDLRVPRIEPPIGVRYRPLDKAVIDQANRQIVESKAKDAEVVAKASALAHACLGVFEIDDAEKPVGDPASWPKFGPELAELLGLPEGCGAATVVRGLYLTDGDVLAALGELSEWSAQSERLAAEEHEGN